MSDASIKTVIKSHRDLIVWQKAMDLVVAVYQASKSFPKEETYGLTGQMRRAAVSIPANIAEGQGRRLTKEFQQFLAHARGSLLELDTHLELALRLHYLNTEQHGAVQHKVDEVGRLLNGLLRSLNSNI
ncbi:MAG TPA: four helix bundle protein [Pyrinomonadaceae bacterium]|nr:four helix bundle protein [Pyrinomonadaceae bacterium]